MLARAIKMSFWVVYDHLGKLLLVNIFAAIMLAAPVVAASAVLARNSQGYALIFAALLCVVPISVFLPLIQAGLVWMIKVLIEKHDGGVALFFVGMKRFGPRAAAIALLYLLLSACLLSSAWFYGIRMGARVPLVGYGLSAIALWTQFFLLMTAPLALPALIHKDQGVFATMKLAALLTLDNPFMALGLLAHITVLTLLAIMPPVFVFCSVAPIAALQGSAYELLSRKYAAIQAHKESGKDGKEKLVIDFGDDDDEYLCRGFRDLLFPWKD
jgi:hypothetical protein